MELYREDQFGEMLQEEESAVRRRSECAALIAKLERAQTVIDGLRTMPVQPGDIISTGTPPGVGLGIKPTPQFLKAGDVMRLGIDGLGIQQQTVIEFKK